MSERRFAGIDIGGTKMLGVVVAGSDVVAEARVPTPKGADALVAGLLGLVDTLRAEAGDLDALGVGAPGLVDRDGVVHAAPNLVGVRALPLRSALAERTGLAVTVDNDATGALEAEWRMGAARGCDDVVLATLGTGIGGALVSGGILQRGANGFAGEPGHMVVHPEGPPCVCGRRGCWERYASGSGLARLARDAALGGRAGAIVEQAGGDPEAVRGEHLTAAARAGDAEALAVLDEFAWWVALGLVNLTNLVDPALILIGGGLVVEADLLMEPIRARYRELIYAPAFRPLPDIVPAALGERAGALGAALIAQDRCGETDRTG